MAIEQSTKLQALALLKLGKKPTEVSETCNITYPQALKLKKALAKAEEHDDFMALLDIDEAALELMVKQVKEHAGPLVGTLLDSDGNELTESLNKVVDKVNSTDKLQTDLEQTASVLLAKIKIQTASVASAESLLILSEAISKLQQAFFAKGANVQINNLNGNGYEKYLTD